MRKSLIVNLTAALLLLLVYVATGRAGLSLAFMNSSATAVWAPTGIALAATLICGYRVWPVIFLGALLVNLTNTGSLPASLMIAVGNTLEALLGAYLVNRYARGSHVFDQAADIVKFTVLAAMLSTTVSATVGVTSLVLNELANRADYGSIWLTWWLGNATGALIITPVLVLWTRNPQICWSTRQAVEALLLLLCFMLAGFWVFGGWSQLSVQNYPLGFVMLPFIVWFALRFGQRGVATAILILVCIALKGVLHGFGPFIGVDQDGTLLLLQIFMGMLVLTGLILAAVVAERKRVEERLRENSEERYRIVAESASEVIVGINNQAVISYINPAAEKVFGYRTDEMIGQPLTTLMPERLRSKCLYGLQHYLATREKHLCWDGIEIPGLHKDGHELSLELSLGECHQDSSHRFIGIIHDITERKRANEQIRHLAQHDALTGLPNRLLCHDRIAQAIAHARRHCKKVAVLFLDLDGFKYINDSLGHQVGDQLLQIVATRLQACLREEDFVARLGGDEFIISLPAINDGSDAMIIADKVLASLREPFHIDRHELYVTGSIGISFFPADGEDSKSLMRAADTAMYHAKDEGRNHYQFFTPHLNAIAQRRLTLANRLHQALGRHELLLYYQPQVDLQSGKIVAAEALVRWQSPELGLVSPCEFIKIAKNTGLMVSIDEWVLRQACQQLQRWHQAGYPNLYITINMSSQEICSSTAISLMQRILCETHLPPSAVEIDIAEGLGMIHNPRYADLLEQLARLGIRLAVDDFGSGYTSLAALQRYPIHAIKIDQSIVHGFAADPDDSAIIKAIIAVAQSLHLKITAKGVETQAQASFLKTQGCTVAQGFYFKEPLTAQAFSKLLGVAA